MAFRVTSRFYEGMDHLVVLTDEEKAFALDVVATTRSEQNKKAKTKQRRGAEKWDRKTLDNLGACGEQAVAKFLGMEWDGNLGDWTAPDVGPYEVRTRSRHSYDLPVMPETKDETKGDVPFILVTCEDVNLDYFQIRGWIYGHEAMRERYWRTPSGKTWEGGACWLVRPHELWSMDQFPREDNGKPNAG